MNDMAKDNLTKPTLWHPAASTHGMTELHEAAYRNDPTAVRKLLQMGILVDIQDDAGWTPLHWSIDMAQATGEPEEVVQLLLEVGASPNAVDHAGDSVLMMACERSNENIFGQLINAGADVRLRSAKTTPLHNAAGCNFAEAIRRLVSLGADPSETDAEGRTAEQVARESGFRESLEIFVAARKDDIIRVRRSMTRNVTESEVLDFLHSIEGGAVTLIPKQDPQEVFAGPVDYVANNGWFLTIFNHANEWDYIERIRTADGRECEYDEIFACMPAMDAYKPSAEIAWTRYRIPEY